MNFSALPRARPPETMILAVVSSGRSLLAISLDRKALLPLSAAGATVSMAALPPLAAAGSKPVPRTVTADVPTLHEAGVPGYKLLVWFGLQALLAGTPEPIVSKLNTPIAKILHSPDLVKEFAAQGVEVAASTPDRFSELVKSEIAKWGKLVSDAKIKVE